MRLTLVLTFVWAGVALTDTVHCGEAGNAEAVPTVRCATGENAAKMVAEAVKKLPLKNWHPKKGTALSVACCVDLPPERGWPDLEYSLLYLDAENFFFCQRWGGVPVWMLDSHTLCSLDVDAGRYKLYKLKGPIGGSISVDTGIVYSLKGGDAKGSLEFKMDLTRFVKWKSSPQAAVQIGTQNRYVLSLVGKQDGVGRNASVLVDGAYTFPIRRLTARLEGKGLHRTGITMTLSTVARDTVYRHRFISEKILKSAGMSCDVMKPSGTIDLQPRGIQNWMQNKAKRHKLLNRLAGIRRRCDWRHIWNTSPETSLPIDDGARKAKAKVEVKSDASVRPSTPSQANE